jgi:hypothetical protein
MLYFLELDPPQPGFNANFESSAFARASEELEAIEEQLQIKNHFNLFSYADQNSLMPPGYEETEVPWFDAREGIDWVKSLTTHIRAHPSSVSEANKLLDDLTELQDILCRAEQIGAKWHFGMDI